MCFHKMVQFEWILSSLLNQFMRESPATARHLLADAYQQLRSRKLFRNCFQFLFTGYGRVTGDGRANGFHVVRHDRFTFVSP